MTADKFRDGPTTRYEADDDDSDRFPTRPESNAGGSNGGSGHSGASEGENGREERAASLRDDCDELRAEVERLRQWKSEASEVLIGLQDVGKALRLPLGFRITGEDAAEAARRLVADRDAKRDAHGRAIVQMSELICRAEAAEAVVARVKALAEARGRRCNVCTGRSPSWDGHDQNPACEQAAWDNLLTALSVPSDAGEAASPARDEEVERAVRTLLPGLRLANYVERWSPASPAVKALGILCQFVGESVPQAGDLIDPDVPTAHKCRPEGAAPDSTEEGR